MKKQTKTSDGEKTAKINGKYAIIVAFITIIGGGIFMLYKKGSSDNDSKPVTKINEQKVDSGSINNYNAGRDLKIENNNTYNVGTKGTDSIKAIDTRPKKNINEQTNIKSINQSGGQTAKEITNNY